MSLQSLTQRVALLLIVMSALLAGCSQEDSPTASFAPENVEIKPLRDASGVDDAALHASLESIWKNNEGVLMQVFTQTIDCESGGVFVAKPAGWPDGYEVVLTVDPGTIPLNHDKVVEFVIEIPVSGPAEGRNSVPYEFHPDGIVFNKNIHVSMAWPQWAGEAPVSGMDLWYLEAETHDGDQHYQVIDQKLNENEVASGALQKSGGIVRGDYSIDHFSRWSLGDDDPNDDPSDDDDGDGNKTGLPIPAQVSVTEGDACWTSNEYRRTVNVRNDF